ncbi:MAG: sirohydrochlorin cobaltochelatase [Deltaproteobacteria bacterium]|nr:sirohydrochlorin cobaltochelatase [Deltaproteobacteria bacterium]
MPELVLFLSAVFAFFSLFRTKTARAGELKSRNPAIVLVTRGTTDPGELKGLTYIENQVKAAFPCYDVFMSFVSDEVREEWRNRDKDTNFKKYFPNVPEKFYSVKNPITTLALIQETGARLVLVQSLSLIDGPEYHDLVNLVENLRKIKTFERERVPFPWIGLGAPALGLGDGQKENLHRVANSLTPLFEEAKSLNAGVLLIADLAAGVNPGVYHNLRDILRNNYENMEIHIGLPEARIGFRHVLSDLESRLPVPGPILLAPLTLVLGEEVRVDITGNQENSWSNLVKESGYAAAFRMKGLAENYVFAEIFTESLKRLEEAVSRRYTD